MMLPSEYYVLNATSLLLWLFQNCSHEFLVLLVVIGALGLVMVVMKYVIKTVYETLDIIILFLYSIFFAPRRPRVSRHLRNVDVDIRNVNEAMSESSADRIAYSQSLPIHSLHPLHMNAIDDTQSSSTRLTSQALDNITSTDRISRSPRRSRRTVRPRTTDSL